MCKATSNSNISWSKKWNLHLTAFFNNVQSPFNRKMEQSANRKRKGLIKTHQRRSWRFPHSESSRGTAPSPMLRAELSAPIDAGHWSTKGRWFGLIWRALASTVHWLVFLSLKQSKADAGAPHNALLLHPPQQLVGSEDGSDGWQLRLCYQSIQLTAPLKIHPHTTLDRFDFSL